MYFEQDHIVVLDVCFSQAVPCCQHNASVFCHRVTGNALIVLSCSQNHNPRVLNFTESFLCPQDDYRVCMDYNIIQRDSAPICPVDSSGVFTSEVTDFAGQYVKVRMIFTSLRNTRACCLTKMEAHQRPGSSAHMWSTPLTVYSHIEFDFSMLLARAGLNIS